MSQSLRGFRALCFCRWTGCWYAVSFSCFWFFLPLFFFPVLCSFYFLIPGLFSSGSGSYFFSQFSGSVRFRFFSWFWFFSFYAELSVLWFFSFIAVFCVNFVLRCVQSFWTAENMGLLAVLNFTLCAFVVAVGVPRAFAACT